MDHVRGEEGGRNTRGESWLSGQCYHENNSNSLKHRRYIYNRDTVWTFCRFSNFADNYKFGLVGCLDISVSLPKQIVSRPTGWKIVKSMRGLCRQLIPFQDWCLFQRSKSLIESNKMEVQIVFVATCSLVIEYDQNKSDLNI